MDNKFARGLVCKSLVLLISQALVIAPVASQTVEQTSTPTSTISPNSDANVVIQSPQQNNAQNRNVNEISFPNIYPLNNAINTPVNTENDFGFNMSLGINTLDAANVTVYLGFILQPGRTDYHNVRMARLRKETELLESQRQVTQAQLQVLQKQIAEAEVRLQRLQQSPENTVPGSSGGTNDQKKP